MHDAESRALRRAVTLLLAVSVARVAWEWRPGADPVPGRSVLPVLSEAVAEATAEAEQRGRPLGAGARIDPNRAPAVELDRLPGVGASLADAIVEARERGLAFRSPSDLEAVRGIGPALSARLAEHLDFSAAPTARRPSGPERVGAVDVNRAAPDVLTTLPGIGPALAERIVEHRRTRPFTSVEDLLDVRGIGPATLERLRPRVTVSGRRP